mmetsp:Transcript_53340/g.95734  ORF Transcript_53340/g.95734 Transcript_53340/m.95734 type:complete len:293 (+) Transcript_53340:69-947(+)
MMRPLGGAAALPLVLCLVLWISLPSEYADRLAKIPETATRIDNVKPYDSLEKWAANGSQAGLHLLNPSRVEFFDARIRSLLSPPFRILDAGCGGGLVSNALAARGDYKIEAVDLSAEALEFARVEAGKAKLEVNFQKGSLYELPFADEGFDAVIVSDVLEHLHDLPKALAEIKRVLRPGGLLLFDTIHRSLPTYLVAIIGAEYVVGIIQRGSHDWRLFIRPEELGKGLQDLGFTEYLYESFEPSLRALGELSLFSFGLLSADRMRGGWSIGAPGPVMISYIGSSRKGYTLTS